MANPVDRVSRSANPPLAGPGIPARRAAPPVQRDSIQGQDCFGQMWDCARSFFSWVYEKITLLLACLWGEEEMEELELEIGEVALPVIERPVHRVGIPNQVTYERVKGRLFSLPSDLTSKIIFDDQTKTIYFNIDEVTLRALATKYQPFTELLGREGRRLQGLNISAPSRVKRDALVREARTYFARRIARASRPSVEGINHSSHRELFTALFARSKGVCVCEWHGDSSSKYVPMFDMAHLKTCGVRTIFIENYCIETLQEDLDRFVLGDENAKLSKILEAYLDNLATEQGKRRKEEGLEGTFYTEKDLILAAKRERIRVVGIDCEAALQTSDTPKDRLLAFNYIAKRIIEAERGEGSYLVFVGAVHGVDALGVPSLPTLLSIPSFLLKDARKKEFRGTRL